MSTRTDGIIPRWEWREFGDRFGDAVSRLASLSSEAVAGKRRDLRPCARPRGLHQGARRPDRRQAPRGGPRGLERWVPVMKAAFPMRDRCVRGLEALGAVAGPWTEAYTLETSCVVGPSAGCGDGVHKHRVRYMLDGCMSELCEVAPPARPTRSRSRRKTPTPSSPSCPLSGSSSPNVSLPRGLERSSVRRAALRRHRRGHELGQVPPRRAAADGSWRTSWTAPRSRGSAKASTRPEGCDEPIQRTVAAIAGMVDEARAPARRRSPRSARPGCGSRQPRRVRRRGGRPSGIRGRGHLGEEEAASPISPASRAPAGGGDARGLRHRWRQPQFTFGNGDRGRRALQRRRRRGALTERFGLAGAGRRRDAGRRAGRDRRRPPPARRAAERPTASSAWAAR